MELSLLGRVFTQQLPNNSQLSMGEYNFVVCIQLHFFFNSTACG